MPGIENPCLLSTVEAKEEMKQLPTWTKSEKYAQIMSEQSELKPVRRNR
jgi:hypothetical protein